MAAPPDRSNERERIADERERIADERERIADERERIADDRDDRSDARELVLDRWEQRLVERAMELALDDPLEDQAARASARSRRADARTGRHDAADERRAARIDRVIAADGARPAATTGDGLRFTNLALHLHGASRMSDVLDRLLDVALDVVPDCDAAGISLTVDGPLALAAGTAPWVEEIEREQHRLGAGPTPAAMHEAVVRTPDLTSDARWPELQPLRPGSPARSALSYRLTIGGEPTGVLTFYARDVAAFGEWTERNGDILAAQASVALDRTLEHLTYEARYAAWQSALASRDVIGQAKGILMAQHGVSADEAFRELRDVSQRLNVKVRDLAEHLITHRQLPG